MKPIHEFIFFVKQLSSNPSTNDKLLVARNTSVGMREVTVVCDHNFIQVRSILKLITFLVFPSFSWLSQPLTVNDGATNLQLRTKSHPHLQLLVLVHFFCFLTSLVVFFFLTILHWLHQSRLSQFETRIIPNFLPNLISMIDSLEGDILLKGKFCWKCFWILLTCWE